MPALLTRAEIPLAVLRQRPTEPLTAIQEIKLTPQVHQTVGRGRPGQKHDTPDQRPHLTQRTEPLRRRIFKAARLIDHDHVKRPFVAVVPDQPFDDIAIDHVDVRVIMQCCLPVLLVANSDGNPQMACMLPQLALITPGAQRHAQRCNHQHLLHRETVVHQLINRRQRRYRLTHAHIQQESHRRRVDDAPNCVALIRTRCECPTHRSVPRRKAGCRQLCG